jgi:hypothetical protein
VIRRGLASAALALVALALMAAGAAASPRGTVSVFAPVPSPGYPALPHVIGDQIYEGTYSNPLGDSLPSRVYRYSADGHLEQTYVVTGQDLSAPHGVQVAANDAAGRLLLLDKTSGRVIRLDPQTGAQTLYSRVPDLPICTVAAAGAACSPAILDQAPMPDYAAWGPDGSLYVTDYQQAVIWRIPPGGGTATVWLADRRLDGGPFGTACITLLADQHTLLFDQASNGGLGSTSATTGKLYEVAIGADGRPGPLRQIWESGSADAPDGCALSTDGHIFVALVGGPNQIVELDPAGHELARFGQAVTGDNGSPVPFDSPSGLAFDGTQLLVANQSYFAGDSANQVLLAVQTDESAQPTFMPAGAGTAPKAKPPSPTGEAKLDPRRRQAEYERKGTHKRLAEHRRNRHRRG